MVATWELWTREVQADPYPTYARLIQEAPLLWDDGSWVISRYDDVMSLLLDPRVSSARGDLLGLSDDERAASRALIDANHDMMLFLDPPDHTRLRGLVAQAFSARMMEQLRPHIQEVVDRLLESVPPGEPWDVLTTLANPLPSLVIAELLGVPVEDCEQIQDWVNDYARWLGGITDESQYVTVRRAANAAVIAMDAYITEQSAMRRAEPRDDLLTALVRAEEAGDKLSQRELFATCLLLLLAGNETTTNLIGNGLLTLLRHPDQLQRLRDDPSLIRTATEELLRFEGPVHLTGRRLLGPVEVQGQTLEAGTWVSLLLSAANRDPAQFDNPHGLDIGRRPNKHVTFAHGPHFCLGAPLARAQGQIAIQTVVQRFPGLQLATDDTRWRDNLALRGLEELLVVGSPPS